MAQENFDACIQAVWQFDGFKNDRAPGERFNTTWGITAMTWREAVAAGIVNKPQAQCTPDDAIAILRALYWDKTCCAEWSAGVDLMVFDFAMMAGNRSSIECLQQVVGEEDDGIIGIHTMTAVAAASPDILIPELKKCHLDHLSTLHNWHQFKGGWQRRQDVMCALALKMAGVLA